MRDVVVFLLGSLVGGLVVFGVNKVYAEDESEVFQRNLRELKEQRESLEEHAAALQNLAQKVAEKAGLSTENKDQEPLVN